MARPVVTRVKVMLVAAFLLALGGGVVLGLAAGRRTPDPVAAPATRPTTRPGPSWLVEQLDLTPAQRDQMQAIWSQFIDGPAQHNKDTRRALEKERDGAVLSLLTPDQRAEYDRLMAGYAARLAELSAEREKGYRDTVERTKAILNDTQRKRYEELLASRDRDRAGRGHRQAEPEPRSRPSDR